MRYIEDNSVPPSFGLKLLFFISYIIFPSDENKIPLTTINLLKDFVFSNNLSIICSFEEMSSYFTFFNSFFKNVVFKNEKLILSFSIDISYESKTYTNLFE